MSAQLAGSADKLLALKPTSRTIPTVLRATNHTYAYDAGDWKNVEGKQVRHRLDPFTILVILHLATVSLVTAFAVSTIGITTRFVWCDADAGRSVSTACRIGGSRAVSQSPCRFTLPSITSTV